MALALPPIPQAAWDDFEAERQQRERDAAVERFQQHVADHAPDFGGGATEPIPNAAWDNNGGQLQPIPNDTGGARIEPIPTAPLTESPGQIQPFSSPTAAGADTSVGAGAAPVGGSAPEPPSDSAPLPPTDASPPPPATLPSVTPSSAPPAPNAPQSASDAQVARFMAYTDNLKARAGIPDVPSFTPPTNPASRLSAPGSATPPSPTNPTSSSPTGPRPSGDLVPNQFGDSTLSTEEAFAACGPAAAVAFARAQGRNPTLREAVDLAKQYGWTTQQGMAGPGSQQKLLEAMGVPSRLEQGVDWGKVQSDVQGGNPVIIDTPAHYFVATGYDPQSGKFNFEASGTALKAGSRWMTPEEVAKISQPRAALYLDNPATPTPSVAVSAPGGGQLPPIDKSSSQAFIQSVTPYAQQVQAETGIPASIMVGIAANETGYGKFAGGNNFFGIKGANPQTGATFNSPTWEVENGKRVNTTANFRAYDNPADSFRDFAAFLRDNPRYADALKQTGDPAAFIKAVQAAGYATDPNWANQVLSIAGQTNTSSPPAPAAPTGGGTPPPTASAPPASFPQSTLNQGAVDRFNAWLGAGGPGQPVGGSQQPPPFTPPVNPVDYLNAPPVTTVAPSLASAPSQPRFPDNSALFAPPPAPPAPEPAPALGATANGQQNDPTLGQSSYDQPYTGPSALGAASYDQPTTAGPPPFTNQNRLAELNANPTAPTPAPAQAADSGYVFTPPSLGVDSPDTINAAITNQIDYGRQQIGQHFPQLEQVNEALKPAINAIPGVGPVARALNVGPVDIAQQAINPVNYLGGGEVEHALAPLVGDLAPAAESAGKGISGIAGRAAGNPVADDLAQATTRATQEAEQRAAQARATGDAAAELQAHRDAAALRQMQTPPSAEPVGQPYPNPTAPTVEPPMLRQMPVETAPAPTASAPPPPPSADYPLWELSPQQLDDLMASSKQEEQDILVSVFGSEEQANRYRQVERAANGTSDIARADRAAAEQQLMESALTPQQQDYLFHGGELPTVEQIRDYRSAVGGLDWSSPQALGHSLGPAITQVGNEVDPAKMNLTQRLAYTKIRHAMQEATQAGWDLHQVSQAALDAGAARFPDPEDAATMLGRFMKPEGGSADAGNVVPPGQRALPSRIPDLAPSAAPAAPRVPEPSAAPSVATDAVQAASAPVPPTAPGLTSSQTTTARGISDPSQSFDFRYKLVDLGDLVPSHTDTFAPNPAFPAELQPRLRDRTGSQMQVKQIAQRLEPDALLEDVHQLDRGPMIVGPDNTVESGNGRVLALREARANAPQNFANYRDRLTQVADQYGFTPEQVQGMRDPVLVRERTTPMTMAERTAFAEEANARATLGSSTVEKALSDARRLPDDALAQLHVGENQSLDEALRTGTNQPFVQRFVETLSPNERADLLTGNGQLSLAGAARIKAALFAKTYPGDAGQRLATTFFESQDPVVRNIESGLTASLPQLGQTEALIRSGQRDGALSIGDDLAKAVNVMARLKQNGESVPRYLSQQSMFDRELNPLQEQLLSHLNDIGRSPKKVREFLRDYASAVESSADPRQGSMFADALPTANKGEIVDRLVAHQQATANDIGPLFGEEASATPAAPLGPRLEESAPSSAGAAGASRGLDLSRQSGAASPAFAAHLGSAATGVLGSQIGTDDNTTPQERIARGIAGAALGLAAGHAALVGGKVLARAVTSTTPNVVRGINEIVAPARNTPPEVQSALRSFAGAKLQSSVDADTLALQIRQALGKANTAEAASRFERTGQFVDHPTPQQQALADTLRQFIHDTGEAGRANGYITGDVRGANGAKEYFPHVYQDAMGEATSAARKGGLSPQDFYSNARAYPTLEDAVAAGKQPVNSVSDPLRMYAQHVADSEAKYQLVQELRKATPEVVMDYNPVAPNPRPAAGPRPIAGEPLGFTDIPNPPSPPVRGDILPKGWVPGVAIAPQFNGVAFAPEVAKVVKNIVSPSAFRSNALVRGALDVMGASKESLFSLSGFHMTTELRQAYRQQGARGIPAMAQAIWHTVNPVAYDRFRLQNADAFSQAAKAGVTGLSGFLPETEGTLSGLAGRAVRGGVTGLGSGVGEYLQAKQQGEDDQTALTHGLVAGAAGAALGATVAKPLSDGLWNRMVPTLKTTTFQALTQGKKLSPQEASTIVNQTFGGQNLAAIGRSKTVQDALRVSFLAPDWWEGWGRSLAGAVQPGKLGNQQRAYWVRTAVVDGAVGLEGLNLALSGHLTNENEPGHQFDLELTGLYDRNGWAHTDQFGYPYRVYTDVLGPIRSILQAPSDPGRFAEGRLSQPLGTALDMVRNTDPSTGKEIVKTGTPPWQALPIEAGHAISQTTPVGGQMLGQSKPNTNVEAIPQAAGALTGFRTSFASVTAEHHRLEQTYQQQLTDALHQSDVWASTPPSLQPDLEKKYRAIGASLAATEVFGTKEHPQTLMDKLTKDPAFAALPAPEKAAEMRTFQDLISGLRSTNQAGRVQDIHDAVQSIIADLQPTAGRR